MLQSVIYEEFQFPFIFIAILIGYQISVYFFVQYYRYKSRNIAFNDILLSYCLFFGFAMTGLLMRIIGNHFPVGQEEASILSHMTYFFFLIAIDAFLLITCFPSFDKIINTKIPKILLILSIFPLVGLLILEPSSILFFLPLSVLFLGFLYIIFFQYNLVKISKGNIKRRLLLILVGEIFMLTSIIFGSEGIRERMSNSYSEIIVLIFVPILILGFLLIFLGQFRFPAFYEFGWKDNLRKLFILDQNENIVLYEYEFNDLKLGALTDELRENGAENKNQYIVSDDMISGAVIGIEEIISRSISKDQVKMEKISHGEFTVLLEYGEYVSIPLIFVLVIEKEMKSLRFFLQSIKRQFEGFFKEILQNLEDLQSYKKSVFSSFSVIIDNLY